MIQKITITLLLPHLIGALIIFIYLLIKFNGGRKSDYLRALGVRRWIEIFCVLKFKMKLMGKRAPFILS